VPGVRALVPVAEDDPAPTPSPGWKDTMIKIKAGVTPPNLVILAAAANAAAELALTVVVTSGTDGQHMVGSKHYDGAALDFRTRNLTGAERERFMRTIKRRLGRDYDVVLELDHLHIEHDPKAPLARRRRTT